MTVVEVHMLPNIRTLLFVQYSLYWRAVYCCPCTVGSVQMGCHTYTIGFVQTNCRLLAIYYHMSANKYFTMKYMLSPVYYYVY